MKYHKCFITSYLVRQLQGWLNTTAVLSFGLLCANLASGEWFGWVGAGVCLSMILMANDIYQKVTRIGESPCFIPIEEGEK